MRPRSHDFDLGNNLSEHVLRGFPGRPSQHFRLLLRQLALLRRVGSRSIAPAVGIGAGPIAHVLGGVTSRLEDVPDVLANSIELSLQVRQVGYPNLPQPLLGLANPALQSGEAVDDLLLKGFDLDPIETPSGR